MVTGVLSSLNSMRRNSGVEFKKLFSEVIKLGKRLYGSEFEITTPRLSSRQAHRSNHPSTTPEEYYRVSLYNEFLSHVLNELEERFLNNNTQEIVTGLLYLVPSECIQLEEGSDIPQPLADVVELYSDDLPHSVMFSIEYNSWVREWKACSTAIPQTLTEALEICSSRSIAYPNLTVLLKIALTLPITSCESERSFSQLKLIKTARRSTMTESRLTSLALMKINRDQCNQLTSTENIEELVETFVQLHPRRMKFSFMLQDED